MTLPNDKLLTPQEASDFLRIGITRLRQLLLAGELRGLRVGIQWRIEPAELEAYVQRQAAPPREQP